MGEPEPIIKKSSTKKQKLLVEKEKLEKQLLEYGSAVSESQIYHIKNRIKQIDKEITEIDTKKFGNATDKLNQDMAQKNMINAMAQEQGRN